MFSDSNNNNLPFTILLLCTPFEVTPGLTQENKVISKENITTTVISPDIIRYKQNNLSLNVVPDKDARSIHEDKKEIRATEIHSKQNKTDIEARQTIENDAKILPIVLSKEKNEVIKRNLDNFSMFRRKTHFSLPNYDVPNDKLGTKELAKDFNEYKEHVTVQKFVNHENSTMERAKTDTNMQESYQLNIPLGAEIIETLTKQNELVRRLVNYLTIDGRTRKNSQSDFDELLQSISDTKNRINATLYEKTPLNLEKHATSETTTADTNDTVNANETTTLKLPTVMTLIDETQVREALKSDPYVKRILKMAHSKRMKYMMKKYGY